MKKKPEPLTVKELGRILREEFDRDNWGLVDPWYFLDPPSLHSASSETTPRYEDADDSGEYAGLFEVLERVVTRLNERNKTT